MEMSEFSIDYILNRAGEKYIGTNSSLGLIQRIKLQSYHPYTLGSHVSRRELDLLQQQPQHQQQQQQHGLQESRHFPPQGFEAVPMYDWLQYTRYHPPKLPRSLRPGPAKRTPGRLPRIPFSPNQLEALEKAYKCSSYLSAADANKLAESLELTNTRVKIWFQNRRARERREKRERDECCDSLISSNASTPELEIVPIV